MTTLRLPEILKSYHAPSSSSDSQVSEQYDYSGLDDHIKRQDAIGALRDKKFAALATGDVFGAVPVGNQIRDLLAAVKANAPAATERNPNQVASPLVRVTSRSTSSSSKSGGGGFEGMVEPEGQRQQVQPGVGQQPPKQQAGKVNKPPAKPVAAPKPPMLDGRLPGASDAAVQRRLDELNAGIDSDAAYDVSDAPLAPDVRSRLFRQPIV